MNIKTTIALAAAVLVVGAGYLAWQRRTSTPANDGPANVVDTTGQSGANPQRLTQPPLAPETRIDRVSDRIDPETHTYEVRGPVDDPSRTVKAGSYLRAEVEMRSGEPAPVDCAT